MSGWLEWARSWFEVRSFRERLVLAGALVVALLLAIEALSWAPARHRHDAAAAQLASLEEQRVTLQQELDLLDEQEALDPDAAVRRQLDTFDQQVGTLDEKLRSQAIQLIAPEQARSMLRSLIANVRDLRMVALQTEPPTPLVDTEGLDLPVLYRHGIVIDLQGNYLAVLEYLQSLEALPWRLYWYGLEVQANPSGVRSYRLHIYTISLRKEWISV